MIGERPKWVLGVLDEVIGYDKVHRGVLLTGEGLAIVDDVHLDEGLGRKLGVVVTQPSAIHPVDVAHGRIGGQRQWTVQRADLQAAAVQIPLRELPTTIANPWILGKALMFAAYPPRRMNGLGELGDEVTKINHSIG